MEEFLARHAERREKEEELGEEVIFEGVVLVCISFQLLMRGFIVLRS